ncbi:MAG TPA: IgGFc-binding protein, partial [Candidatus Kapabacteria bacterium]
MKKVLLAIFLIIPLFANAQGYRGRDFWIAFPQNAVNESGKTLSFTLFICAEQRTSGTIINLATNDTQKFELEYGSEIECNVDTAVQMLASETFEKKSVHIMSDGDISVYVISHRPATTDSYMAIPTDKLGTEYIEAGYTTLQNGDESFASQLAVVATQNNTLVTFHLTGRSKFGIDSGRNVEIAMQQGQTFLMQGDSKGDLTGTTVTSTKPFAFFSGHSCAQVPSDASFCDILLESEPPQTDWGRQFIVPKIEGKNFSVVRIIAGSDSTRVFLDGKPYRLLRKTSDYCEIDTLHFDAIVSTSKPSLLAQYCTSTDMLKTGDPFMLFIIPTERFLTETTTATLIHGAWNHYLNIVLPDSALKTLRIDGTFAGLNGVYPSGIKLLHATKLPAVKMTVLT